MLTAVTTAATRAALVMRLGPLLDTWTSFVRGGRDRRL
jgi:hypothetical protein